MDLRLKKYIFTFEVTTALSSGCEVVLPDPRTIHPPEFDPIEFDLSREFRDRVDGLSGRDEAV